MTVFKSVADVMSDCCTSQTVFVLFLVPLIMVKGNDSGDSDLTSLNLSAVLSL